TVLYESPFFSGGIYQDTISPASRAEAGLDDHRMYPARRAVASRPGESVLIARPRLLVRPRPVQAAREGAAQPCRRLPCRPARPLPPLHPPRARPRRPTRTAPLPLLRTPPLSFPTVRRSICSSPPTPT